MTEGGAAAPPVPAPSAPAPEGASAHGAETQSRGRGRGAPRARGRGGRGRGGRGGRGQPTGRRGGGRGRGGDQAGVANGASSADPETVKEAAGEQPAAPNGHAARPRSGRRQRFQAQLTQADDGGAGADGADAGVSPAPTASDLRSRLVFELAHNELDCLICFNTVTRKNATWSCSRCYAILHLGCVRKWASRSVAQIEEQNAMHEDPAVRDTPGCWRCPGCQAVRTAVPDRYVCWCGRVTEPRGTGAIPHSCGRPCARGCAWHGCPAGTCHPGPCPPCPASVAVACFCGKQTTLAMRCSQLREHLPPELAKKSLPQVERALGGVVSCAQPCGKRLACGLHTCTRTCHAGPCGKCEEQLTDAPCHCGRERRTLRCGDRDVPGAESAWSCGAPCGAPLACGHHTCSRPCHIRDEQPAPCPYAPERVHTCFCGRTPVDGRHDCRDAIPSCGLPCARRLPCGHECTAACHPGPCPACSETVVQVCRCGAEKRRVKCSGEPAADGAAGEPAFLCNATCKAQRHCGKHQCGQRCCPLAALATLSKKRGAWTDAVQLDPDGVHACTLRCGRLLACGRHRCERECHRGACGPCLQSTFEEVTCACGRTVLEPPVPCGTRVECTYPCPRPGPPCGHPKVPHSCHPPETPCPPCVHLTSRACACGKHIMPSVPCSRAQVRCGRTCGRLLACGLHRCERVCHSPEEGCPPCTHKCGQPRPLCGHACPLPCHAPEPCPEKEPCTAVVVRKCACGHLEKMDVCGAVAGGGAPAASHQLECTAACRMAQRNARVASALGLAAPPAAARTDALYSDALVRFAASDRRTAQAVQDVLCDFVQSPRAFVYLRQQLQLHAVRQGLEPPRTGSSVLAFARELAGVFSLAVEPCTEEGALQTGTAPTGRVDLRLRRTRECKIPEPLLVEYVAANPDRARRALAYAPPPTPAPKAPWAPAATRRPSALNALVLSGLPAHLHDDVDALALALEGASLSHRRTWRSTPAPDGGVVLHDFVLEPLSLAAVASGGTPSPATGALGALSLPERRLAHMRDEVRGALLDAVPDAAAVAVELAEFEPGERGLVRVAGENHTAAPAAPARPESVAEEQAPEAPAAETTETS